MRIGIGLPNVLPGTSGRLMIDWAVRAEERGFAFVSTIGRPVYPSFDSLTSLAAAAGATRTIRLMTNVELGPLLPTVHLAAAALSVDGLSGGRLRLGLGLGARRSDYDALGAAYRTRARTFETQLATVHKVWAGEADGDEQVVPTSVSRVPEILVAGYAERTALRVARWGVGWTGANGGAERNGPVVAAVRRAWAEHERDGEPELVALQYAALGPAAAEGPRNITDYYAFFGPERSTAFGAATATDPGALRAALADLAEQGMTDVVLSPGVAELDQVDRIADAVLDR